MIATRQESVEFIELSANQLNWNKSYYSIIWEGKGLDEVGRRADTGEIVIRIDPRYFRPAEVSTLLGDASKAREILGWTPRTSLEQLIEEMIDLDQNEAEKEALLLRQGYKVIGPRE